MRMLKRNPWLSSLGVVLAVLTLWGARAGADVLSDRPGSIVIWPKVIADGTRDTLISLTNNNNSGEIAHCEYILGTGVCTATAGYCGAQIVLPSAGMGLYASPECPTNTGFPNNLCLITWQTLDFDVTLTRQQPTIWRVSTGREAGLFPAGTSCTNNAGPPETQDCPGLTTDPVIAPPQAALLGAGANDPSFRGALVCIQVATDGSPLAGNALKGEALIQTVGSNQISKYNASNVQGIEDLGLQNPADDAFYLELNGVAYNACPEALDVTHYGTDQQDLVADTLGADCTGDTCLVHTQITLFPCRNDFANEVGTPALAAIRAVDEFESPFSFGGWFDCWENADITQLGYTNINSSMFFHSRIRNTSTQGICSGPDPTPAGVVCSTDADCDAGEVCAPRSGLLAVVEEFHEVAGTDYVACLLGIDPACDLAEVAVDAANSFASNTTNGAGDVTLQRRGRCHNDLGTRCDVTGSAALSTDCTAAGACRFNPGTSCSADADCPAGDFCYQCMNDEIIF